MIPRSLSTSRKAREARARRDRHRALGLCSKCATPALPGRSQCERHDAQLRARNADPAWRQRNRETMRRVGWAKRERAFWAGQCSDCPADAEVYSRCGNCRRRHNARMRRTRRRLARARAGARP